jgi:hypothetical protein
MEGVLLTYLTLDRFEVIEELLTLPSAIAAKRKMQEKDDVKREITRLETAWRIRVDKESEEDGKLKGTIESRKRIADERIDQDETIRLHRKKSLDLQEEIERVKVDLEDILI